MTSGVCQVFFYPLLGANGNFSRCWIRIRELLLIFMPLLLCPVFAQIQISLSEMEADKTSLQSHLDSSVSQLQNQVYTHKVSVSK